MEYESKTSSLRASTEFSSALRAWITREIQFDCSTSDLEIIIRKLQREPMKEIFTYLSSNIVSTSTAERIRDNLKLSTLSSETTHSQTLLSRTSSNLSSKLTHLHSLSSHNQALLSTLVELEQTLLTQDLKTQSKLQTVHTLEEVNSVSERLISNTANLKHLFQLASSSIPHSHFKHPKEKTPPVEIRLEPQSDHSFHSLKKSAQISLLQEYQSLLKLEKTKLLLREEISQQLSRVAEEYANNRLLIVEESSLHKIRTFLQVKKQSMCLSAALRLLPRTEPEPFKNQRLAHQDLHTHWMRAKEEAERSIGRNDRFLHYSLPNLLSSVRKIKESFAEFPSFQGFSLENTRLIETLSSARIRVQNTKEHVTEKQAIQTFKDELAQARDLELSLQNANLRVKRILESKCEDVTELENATEEFAGLIEHWWGLDWLELIPWKMVGGKRFSEWNLE